jgi:hypothetical protein
MGGDESEFRSQSADIAGSSTSNALEAARFGWKQGVQGPFDLLQQTRTTVQTERNERELMLWHTLMPIVAPKGVEDFVVASQVVKPSASISDQPSKQASPKTKTVKPYASATLEPAGDRDEIRRMAIRSDGERGRRNVPLKEPLPKKGARKKTKPFQLLSINLNYAPRSAEEKIPLSWRLTPEQLENLDASWNELKDTLDQPFAFDNSDSPISSMDELFGRSK